MKKLTVLLIALLIAGSAVQAQKSAASIKELIKTSDYNEAAQLVPQALKENPKDRKVWEMCGDVYIEVDKIDSALVLYRAAYEMDKDDLEVLRKVANTLSLLKKHTEAIETINIAIKKDPKNVYFLLDLGRLYTNADSLDRASVTITRAREMNKKIPDGFAALGELYFKQKVYELAKQNYEEALSINEKLLEVRQNLAITYGKMAAQETDPDLQNKLFTQSLVEWNKLTRQDPKNARAFLEQGKLFYFSNRKKEAAISLNSYVELRPQGSYGRWLLAQSLYEYNDFNAALKHLPIVAKELDSVKVKASQMIARCYFFLQNMPEANAAYKKLYEMNPQLEDMDFENIAKSSILTGDTTGYFKYAMTYVNRPLMDQKRESVKCDFNLLLAKMLNMKKMYDEAIKYFYVYINKCGKIDAKGNVASSYFSIGTAYFSMEKYDSAMIAFNTALEKNPKDIRTMIFIGDTYTKLSNKDSAIIVFENALENAKGDTTEATVNLVGKIYVKLCSVMFTDKNANELLKYSTAWASIDPNASWAYFYQALAYHLKSNKDEVCKALRKALQADPNNPNAKKLFKDYGC